MFDRPGAGAESDEDVHDDDDDDDDDKMEDAEEAEDAEIGTLVICIWRRRWRSMEREYAMRCDGESSKSSHII